VRETSVVEREGRRRLRVGWPASILLGLAVWIACAGIMSAGWVEGDIVLLFVGLVSLLLTGALSASGLAEEWAAAIVTAVGLLFVAQLVARPFPPFGEGVRGLASLVRWLWQRAAGSPSSPLDAALWIESARRWAVFAGQLAAWAGSLFGGAPVHNPAAFLFVSGTILWLATAWAVWGTVRRGRPLLAMLPLGLALGTSTYLASAPLGWVLGFVACEALLLPVVHLRAQEQRWEREGIDYSPEISFDVWQVAILLAVGIVLLSTLTPNLHVPRLAWSFWERMGRAGEAIADGTTRFFGGIEPRQPPSLPVLGESTAGGQVRASGLPRAHLLSGSPARLRQRVMVVCTDAPPPGVADSSAGEGLAGPQYYWRGITYDTFDGRSWRNGPSYQDELLPYGPVQGVASGETRLLQQRYRIEAGEGRMLFAAAEPVAVDQPVTRLLRAPGDLIGLEGAAREYVVRSQVPRASAAGLRAASSAYPEPIRSRYLVLREGTPARLRALAAEVTAGAATAYDRALAIERYLRQFEYDLDVTEPPPGQDAVDYFLFDLQRGYCDYTASAFVVLARAAGVPARLAVGYGTGEYDPAQGCYEVRELDGHAWPEVYFPGYGWIPFEPTAAYRPFERRAGVSVPGQPAADVPPPPRRSLTQVARVWWQRVRRRGTLFLIAGGTGTFAALAAAGYRRWWRSRLTSTQRVALCYEEMARMGTRLGVARRPSHTAREVAAALSAAVQRRAARWPGRAATASSLRRGATVRIQSVSEAYVRVSYAGRPPTQEDRARVEAIWRALRWRMWWLWALSTGAR
jgi:transglutaminase-like putative cysteine protease